MALDPPIKSLLDKLASLPPKVDWRIPDWKGMDWRGPVETARQQFWQAAHRFEAEAPALAKIEPLTVKGAEGPLNARLYTPFAAGAPTGPGLVYFHGGGFVVGDLDSHEMLCRRLAASSRVRVLSVAYRLAPEHRFPAAVDDCLACVRDAFVSAERFGFDAARIAVGGDSAGGNLAAVVAQSLKQEGGPALKAQLLIYPCTQFVQMTPSQIRLKEGYHLTQAAQDWFKDAYLTKREDAFDVRVSPLLANDLAGLPQTLLITAGFDPLLDEGKAYADKLIACGVPVTYRDYPNQVHGFFNMTAVSSKARAAIEEAGAWLGDVLAQ
jgi:acetyl esterase